MVNGMIIGVFVYYRIVAVIVVSRISVLAWRSVGEMTFGVGISVLRRWVLTWWMWSAVLVIAMISGRWVISLTFIVGLFLVFCWFLVGKKIFRVISGKNGVAYVSTVWG